MKYLPDDRQPWTSQVTTVGASRLSGMVTLLMTGTLAGFLMVSYLPGALGVDSRIATVPFRGLMLLLQLYALFRFLGVGHLRMGMSVISVAAVFFWTAYSLRFIVDAAFLEVPLGTPPSDMALSLFAICLPTFLVLYQVRNIELYKKALPWSMLALGVCCLASMLRTRTSQDVTLHGRYQGNDILNSVSYGHMGVTAIILGLFVLLQIGRIQRPWYLRAGAAVTVCLGAFSILAASSRGALVAGILVVPVVGYLGLRCGSRFLTVAIGVVLALFLSVTTTYFARNGLKLDRLLASAAAYDTTSDSVNTRHNLIRDAWREYMDHPWLGNSIVERNALIYPHNAVVEAFMATGTFGGSAFVLLIVAAVYRALRFIRRDAAMAWIPVCFFQQLIGAMFSGGLYGNVPLWAMMAIMLGADLPPHPAEDVPIESIAVLMIFQIKEILDCMFYPFYLLRGRKPWTPGYYTAKRRRIESAIEGGLLRPAATLPKGYGFRMDERVIEYPWVYARLPGDPGMMLDAGAALNHGFLVRRPPVSKAKLSICTLAPEKQCHWRRAISYVFDDLRSCTFRSEMFDTIVSISTIEHIGLDNTLLYTTDRTKREEDAEGFRAAVREFRRVIRPGGVCFITVPYGKACHRGWFQVFDATMVRAVLEDFQPAQAEVEYFAYSPDGWHASDPAALIEATFFDIHQDRCFAPDYAAAARGLICMRLVA